MKSVLKWGMMVAVLFALVGCHPIRAFKSRANSCHVRQPYMSAQSVPPLKIPPGLDNPDTTNALHIPDLKEPAPPKRSGKDPCLDEPPPFKVAKPAPQA
ncbi:MAG TPA: hypothetical protein VHB68_07460 [Steroidobacteraceae bacterium]|nr:hypothetical protein [Steroidobacteraceae bacterium]